MIASVWPPITIAEAELYLVGAPGGDHKGRRQLRDPVGCRGADGGAAVELVHRTPAGYGFLPGFYFRHGARLAAVGSPTENSTAGAK